MDCERWQEALSALADGEDPGIDQRLIDAHLAQCPSCRSFRDGVERLHRASRLQAADTIPDLSGRIVKLNAVADRASRWGLARVLLAVVAIQIMAFSIPDLLKRDAAGSSAHSARHLGAFTVAYGVGLLVVVIRPARARTILPVAAVLAGGMVLTAAVDLLSGRIPLVGEVTHVPEILSVVLVWLLAVPSPRRSERQSTRPQLRAPLHVVEDDADTA
jgi:predicted anti-sigma-YlaC factor YlaD